MLYIYGFLMNHKPKRVIIPEEKLDIASDTSQETIKRVHLDLLYDFDVSQIPEENIYKDINEAEEISTTDVQKYLFPLPQRKIREYSPELEATRESLEENNENVNFV
jgi:hypothetical protein